MQDKTETVVEMLGDVLTDVLYNLDDCYQIDILQTMKATNTGVKVGDYTVMVSGQVVLADGAKVKTYNVMSPIGTKLYSDISNIIIAVNISMMHRLRKSEDIDELLKMDIRYITSLQERHLYRAKINSVGEDDPRYDIFYAKYSNATAKFKSVIDEIGNIC